LIFRIADPRVGCGTTTSDEGDRLATKEETRSTAAVSTDRGNQSRKQDDNEDKDDKQTQEKGKGRKNLNVKETPKRTLVVRYNKKVKAKVKRLKKKKVVL